jgi:hypothetical protein
MMVIYGLPYMAYAIAALPLALFVPSYYADDMALPLAAVGIAIAASRIRPWAPHRSRFATGRVSHRRARARVR